jgi:hypothetical protein
LPARPTTAADSTAALTNLFGGKKKPPPGSVAEREGHLSKFDPAIYAQVKPHFVKAASKFDAFLDDISELVRRMVRELREADGWTREMLEEAKPYFRKFIDEVKAGDITREENGRESILRLRNAPMSTLALKSKILKHWKEWLPEKYDRLKKEGRLDQEAQARASMVQEEIESLRARGYQEHEAEEAVQAQVLEKPEVDGLVEEQRAEPAEKEREYQKNPPAG